MSLTIDDIAAGDHYRHVDASTPVTFHKVPGDYSAVTRRPVERCGPEGCSLCGPDPKERP